MFLVVDRNDGEINQHWMSSAVPRPVGWISTISRDGVPNLAPYRFFNALSENPPVVMFGSNGRHAHGAKKLTRKILEADEVVCNMATCDLCAQVRTTSKAERSEISEFERAELEIEASSLVPPPQRIKPQEPKAGSTAL